MRPARRYKKRVFFKLNLSHPVKERERERERERESRKGEGRGGYKIMMKMHEVVSGMKVIGESTSCSFDYSRL